MSPQPAPRPATLPLHINPELLEAAERFNREMAAAAIRTAEACRGGAVMDMGAFVGLASEERRKAVCRRRQVGCVIVKDGAVVGRGHNRSRDENLSCLAGDCPRGHLSYDELPAKASYDVGNPGACLAIHAEEMALAEAGLLAAGALVYVTCSPCDGCASLLAKAGVGMVIVEDLGAPDRPYMRRALPENWRLRCR